MSKPKQEPFLPANREPEQECRTCDNWVPKKTADGMIDYASGKCPATGLSSCPARHVCELWKARTRKKGGEE